MDKGKYKDGLNFANSGMQVLEFVEPKWWVVGQEQEHLVEFSSSEKEKVIKNEWYWKVMASPIKEHYQPAVKFWKIDKAILERLQTGASNTTLAQAEVVEFQDDNSNVEEPEGNWADRGEVDREKLAFTIDPQ